MKACEVVKHTNRRCMHTRQAASIPASLMLAAPEHVDAVSVSKGPQCTVVTGSEDAHSPGNVHQGIAITTNELCYRRLSNMLQIQVEGE